MRLHLRYKHFKPDAVAATEALFAQKLWRLNGSATAEDEQSTAMQQWADKMCTIYGVPHLHVAVDAKQGYRYGNYTPPAYVMEEDETPHGMQEGSIILGQFSLTNLLWHFATHLQVAGLLRNNGFYSSFSWATSMFYTVRPVMFRARVREGRIAGVTPRDTYSSETFAQMLDAGIDPDAKGALDELRGAENEAISLDDPPATEAEILAETESVTAPRTNTRADFDGQAYGRPLTALTTRELRRYATERGITGSWGLTKPQLLEALGVTNA